jgi:hypothetical protein
MLPAWTAYSKAAGRKIGGASHMPESNSLRSQKVDDNGSSLESTTYPIEQVKAGDRCALDRQPTPLARQRSAR